MKPEDQRRQFDLAVNVRLLHCAFQMGSHRSQADPGRLRDAGRRQSCACQVTNLGFARREPEGGPKRDNEFRAGTHSAAPVDDDAKRRRRGKDIARVTAKRDQQQNRS